MGKEEQNRSAGGEGVNEKREQILLVKKVMPFLKKFSILRLFES